MLATGVGGFACNRVATDSSILVLMVLLSAVTAHSLGAQVIAHLSIFRRQLLIQA